MVAGLQPGFRFTEMPIQLGALTFGQVDSEGVHWHCATLSGWDGTDVKVTVSPREADHGSWLSPVYMAERVITLAGKAFAPDMASLDRAIDRLTAAASLTDTTLTVWDSTPRQATVRRSGKPLAERLTDRVADWSLLLTAADPRRYGVTLLSGQTGLPVTSGGRATPYTPPYTLTGASASGQIICANPGTLDTRPLITITGPVTAPQVLAQMPDGTVRPLAYSQTLGAGDVLVIDVDGKDATLNGVVSRRRFLSVPLGWPAIPASSTAVFTFAAASYNAAALLTVQWRPAWI